MRQWSCVKWNNLYFTSNEIMASLNYNLSHICWYFYWIDFTTSSKFSRYMTVVVAIGLNKLYSWEIAGFHFVYLYPLLDIVESLCLYTFDKKKNLTRRLKRRKRKTGFHRLCSNKLTILSTIVLSFKRIFFISHVLEFEKQSRPLTELNLTHFVVLKNQAKSYVLFTNELLQLQ